MGERMGLRWMGWTAMALFAAGSTALFAQNAAQRAALAKLAHARSGPLTIAKARTGAKPGTTERAELLPLGGVGSPGSPLDLPHGIAFDTAGNLYIADTDNHVIREVNLAGTVTIVAGDGEQGYSGDGGPATSALLDSPAGVAVDSNSNIYIADTHNHAIREVLASSGNISTIAGIGGPGFSGDGLIATGAALDYPTGVAVDSSGNVYIADTNNHRIREISGGIINTVAGNGDQAYEGDGVAATATGLDSPNGVGVDGAHNIYIGDTHNQRVRMVTYGTGLISTLAGTGAKGFNGDGMAIAASLARPRGVAVDIYGNVYVADSDNNLIRTISGGNLTTIAGNGTEGANAGGTDSATTSLDTPDSVAVLGTSIVFSDTENSVIGDVMVPPPPVTLSAGNMAFGGTELQTWSTSQWVSVVNTGTASLSIASISLTGANSSQFADDNTCGSTLAVGASCFIHAHFQPTVTGPAAASIVITDSAANSPQTISLSGTGLTPSSSLAFLRTSIAFGSANVGTSSGEQEVLVTNTGGAAISFTSIAVTGANASSFDFANNCGASLAAGANCTIHGHFAPTVTGALTASVVLTDSDTNSPQSITLSGTGVQPLVSLSSASLAYGSTTLNTPSELQSVTLTNSGTSALAITSIAVTGTNASEFVFANNCGTSLAAGASCTIHGHFAPTALGAATASITITDNAPDSPESISLTGTGAPATDSVTLSATNLLPGSTPTNLVFGSIDMGAWSQSQWVSITNTGTSTLSISSITVGGLNASQFLVGNTCGATLAVGASCAVHAHFQPTATGPMTAMITITDSDTTSPQTIALSGTGVTPAITFSLYSLSYPPTTVGTSTGSQSVTMTNVGSSTLTISSIAVTGVDASSFVFANNCGATLAMGASCTIHGHFAPTATGPMTASVTITSSAPGSPESISLSGTGQ